MVFNVHVTRIPENPTSSELSSVPRASKNGKRPATQTAASSSLVTVPADNRINKYPVRIINIQPEE